MGSKRFKTSQGSKRILSSDKAPEAKYFIEKLATVQGILKKDFAQTTAFFESLIQQGLSHRMEHPNIRNRLAEILVDDDQDRVCERSFIKAIRDKNLHGKEAFHARGNIYNGLKGSTYAHFSEVKKMAQRIKPYGWLTKDELQEKRRGREVHERDLPY